MDINAETMEFLENRLAERVEGQVRTRLFRFYRAIWAAALVALGFFGYNVIAGLRDVAKDYAEKAVAPAVTKANEAALKALDQASAIEAHLQVMEDFQKQRLGLLMEAEDRANADQERVARIAATTDQRLEGIAARLAEAQAQVDAIGQRSKEAAGAGNITDLAADLLSLTEQVKGLDATVRSFGTAAEPGDAPPAPVLAADGGTYAAILDSVKAQVAVAPSERPTVYLQFAGVNRAVAQSLSSALDAAGYSMPGAERTDAALGKHEVRYFFAADADRAARLAADVNRVLAQAGYETGVTVRDATGYKAAKPREGTLELWLEPVPLS